MFTIWGRKQREKVELYAQIAKDMAFQPMLPLFQPMNPKSPAGDMNADGLVKTPLPPQPMFGGADHPRNFSSKALTGPKRITVTPTGIDLYRST